MKSYVSMEQKVCLVCAKTFDSGAILLDKRLQESMEHNTVTGWDLCPDDKQRHEDGYVALVEARAPTHGDRLQPGEAYRLGRIAHVREAAFTTIFNGVSPRDESGALLPLVFIEPDAMDKLEEISRQAEGSN